MITKHVWKGKDNEFVLKFSSIDEDGVETDMPMAVVTQMMVEFGDAESGLTLTVAKDEANAPIDWWSPGLDLNPGYARFELGHWAAAEDVPEGGYVVRITLYSLNAPNGVVWTSFANSEVQLVVHE